MRYVLEDVTGDVIVVQPGSKSATNPHVLIEFREYEDGQCVSATMKLDDRKARDFRQAINRSLRESEEAG